MWFFALESLVGVALVAPNAYVVANVRCVLTLGLHCQEAFLEAIHDRTPTLVTIHCYEPEG